MGKRLYVGSLSYGTTQESLEEAFSQAGSVESVVIVSDKETGRPRGFGFVEMSTDDEAQKAIEMFNNAVLDGRTIVVNNARPRNERSGSGARRGGFKGGFGR